MNKTGHAIGGLSAGIIVIDYLSKQNMLDGVLFSMPSFYTITAITVIEVSSYIGCLFPDIDHPISTAGKKLKTTSKTLHSLYGHRGVTHFPLFLVWVSFMMYIIFHILSPGIRGWWMYFCYGFIVGWLSHIFLDCFNSAGVRLLAPFCQIHFKIPTGVTWKKPRRNQKAKRNTKKTMTFKYKKSSKESDKFCFIVSIIAIIICILI